MTPTFRRDATLATLVVLAVVAVVSLAPPPGASRLSGDSHDFAHVLVFGVLGLALARTLRQLPGRGLRWTGIAAITLAVGAVAGVGTEYAQGYTGGMPSKGDVARDLLGTAVGLCAAIALTATTAPRTRALLWTAAALGLLAGAIPLGGTLLDYRARDRLFPVILDPAAPRGLAFVSNSGAPVHRASLPAGLRDGGTVDVGEYDRRRRAAREGGVDPRTLPPPLLAGDDPRAPAAAPAGGAPAVVISLQRGQWPGLTFDEPVRDWRGWRSLVLDLANVGDAPLPLGFRVNDLRHDNRYVDRYDTTLELPPRSRQRFAFPIDAIRHAPQGREMDLDQIAKVIVFHAGAAPGRELYVLGLTLVG